MLCYFFTRRFMNMLSDEDWKKRSSILQNSDMYSGRRGRDYMVVRFTTTCGISANHYSIQHYMIKFVCDLRQFGGFLRVLNQ